MQSGLCWGTGRLGPEAAHLWRGGLGVAVSTPRPVSEPPPACGQTPASLAAPATRVRGSSLRCV